MIGTTVRTSNPAKRSENLRRFKNIKCNCIRTLQLHLTFEYLKNIFKNIVYFIPYSKHSSSPLQTRIV